MLGRLERVSGKVPQKEDFRSAERHILPIRNEVAKQKGQAQNQTKFLFCLKLITQPSLALPPWHRRALEQEEKEADKCALRCVLLGAALFKYPLRVPTIPFRPLWGSISQVKSSPFPKLDSGFRSSYLTIGTPEHSLAKSLQSERVFKALHGIVTAFPE